MGKVFTNKMSQVCDMPGLREILKGAILEHGDFKVFVCESLFVLALGPSLQGPLSRQSKDIIRSQLAAVAGNQVKESLVHPVLLSAARDVIG